MAFYSGSQSDGRCNQPLIVIIFKNYNYCHHSVNVITLQGFLPIKLLDRIRCSSLAQSVFGNSQSLSLSMQNSLKEKLFFRFLNFLQTFEKILLMKQFKAGRGFVRTLVHNSQVAKPSTFKPNKKYNPRRRGGGRQSVK